MNKAAGNASGYTWMANTFENVGGGVTKLKEFSLSESQAPTGVRLYLLDKVGATLIDDGKQQVFVYVHPARCTQANGWISGWYYFTLNGINVAAAQFKLGSESAYWANEVEIPYGQGFGLYRGTGTTTIVFSGAVSDSDANISAVNASGYTWSGNVMPSEVTLSDLSLVESQAPTGVRLYKLDKVGATSIVDGKQQVFVYVHPARCTQANGWISGWYYFTLNGTNVAAAQFKLGSESAYWANDIVIKAGEGFGVYRGTGTTTLVVPSPLADKE